MRYDERVIDEVQAATDIIEIIGQYVPLKRSGRNFKGLCPFHEEKTPSFMVQPEKQIFHCFGCGAGGNVFSFLMRYENASFPEVLRQMAEKAHIRLPEKNERPETASENEKLYEMYRLAEDYYHKMFLHPQTGDAARRYLASRQFRVPEPEELKIGWAPDAWRGLFDFLSAKGYASDLITKAGLAHRSAKGHFYDAFRGRLMFPIKNHQGKTVAFGGRLIQKAEGPKYLNSPENPVFFKRRELFGLYLAKRFIDRDHPRVVVVEGYLDFLRLYQAGIKNVVATLGTALTDQHVQLLKRFAEEAIVVYDGDKAGEMASIRGLEVFLEGGLSVKLVRLPEGLDPDDFVAKSGAEEFRRMTAEAQDFFDFKLQTLLGRYNRSDSLGLIKMTNDFLETFLKVGQPLLVDKYLRRLAASLGIDETSLRAEFLKLQQKAGKKKDFLSPAVRPAPVSESGLDEVLMFTAALEEKSALHALMTSVDVGDLEEPWQKTLYEYLRVSFDSGRVPAFSQVINRLPDDRLRQAFVKAGSMEWTPEMRSKTVADCLKSIYKRRKDKRLAELRRQISKAELDGDQALLGRVVRQYQDLFKQTPGEPSHLI